MFPKQLYEKLAFLPSNSASASYSIFLLRGLVGFPWVSLRLSMALCLLPDPPLPMTFPLLYHSPLLSFTMILLSCPPYTIKHPLGSRLMGKAVVPLPRAYV